MGTITQNLEKLVAAKSAIAAAITAKGGTVNAGDGFEEFAADIGTIPYDPPGPEHGRVRIIQWNDSWTVDNFQTQTDAVYFNDNDLPSTVSPDAAGLWIIYNIDSANNKFKIATYKSSGEYYSKSTQSIDYIKSKISERKLYFYFA
jgi:hypothetical protein